ncbi:trypsin-like serine peptidase [Thermomicrobium sp.]
MQRWVVAILLTLIGANLNGVLAPTGAMTDPQALVRPPAGFAPASPMLLAQAAERARYQRIFPPDDRVRVTPTTSLPASAIVLLVGEAADGALFSCSGTLIGPAVVLTAAHCLYLAERGGWATRLVVIPGADRQRGQLVTPFGTASAADGSVPRGWVEGGISPDETYDFGVVLLDRPLGDQAGSLPLAALADSELENRSWSATLAGYPGDKPFGTLWFAPVGRLDAIGSALLATDVDAVQGMSGGPLLREDTQSVFGIVVAESFLTNFARRVTPDVARFAELFCAEVGCRLGGSRSPAPPSRPEPRPAPPAPGIGMRFVAVEPARYATVPPGRVRVSVQVESERPLRELVVRVASYEARSDQPAVSLDAWLDPGNYTIEAVARDTRGRELRTLWDIVVSWDLGDTLWFDSQGRPKADAINATVRALVEAFRWHLYGTSWDGRDHRGTIPTHAQVVRPPEPVPVLVSADGFDRPITEATLRALVEAFRWHLYGISWDGAPHPEIPTHVQQLLPPEPIAPWFTPEGQPIPEAITATLRALQEAFRWHLYGATWDGTPRLDMPTHAWE